MTLVHPQFDPIALQLGPLAIRWYGLMYVVAFVLVIVLGRVRARRNMLTGWRAHDVDDMLFYGVFGVILGGRLGYVLFYKPLYYLEHPLEIVAVWQGGMSFHGGMLGVLVALWLYARKRNKRWLDVTDFVAPLVPLGLAAGRLGNFINGELWGRPTNADWGMIFPQVDNLARHPSQLYQFALEGLLLFAILWTFANRPRPMGGVGTLPAGLRHDALRRRVRARARCVPRPARRRALDGAVALGADDRRGDRDDGVGVRARRQGASDDPRPHEVNGRKRRPLDRRSFRPAGFSAKCVVGRFRATTAAQLRAPGVGRRPATLQATRSCASPCRWRARMRFPRASAARH
jgi:phosphatidylglycerol:prolipoprotein diacylglycerol transferase